MKQFCIDCYYWSPKEMAIDHNLPEDKFVNIFGYCMANIEDNCLAEKVFVPFHPQDRKLKFLPFYYSWGNKELKPIRIILKQFFKLLFEYLKAKFNAWRFKRHRRYIYTASKYGCVNFKYKCIASEKKKNTY